MTDHDAAAVQAAMSASMAWNHTATSGAGLRAYITAILGAARPHLAAAERERIFAELGNDHYAIFTKDRWTVEHSAGCRLSGQMPECATHAAVARFATDYGPAMSGRWRVTGINGDGLPGLARAEPAAPDADLLGQGRAVSSEGQPPRFAGCDDCPHPDICAPAARCARAAPAVQKSGQ